MVIVNLQKTPLDDLASLRIYALCDDVMVRLMKKLDIPIQNFNLKRRIGITRIKNKEISLRFRGLDIDDCPYTLFKSIEVGFGKQTTVLKKEPFIFTPISGEALTSGKVLIVLEPQGHYDELPCKLSFDLKDLGENEMVLKLEYDLGARNWIIGSSK